MHNRAIMSLRYILLSNAVVSEMRFSIILALERKKSDCHRIGSKLKRQRASVRTKEVYANEYAGELGRDLHLKRWSQNDLGSKQSYCSSSKIRKSTF
jgi:hypothetical protein